MDASPTEAAEPEADALTIGRRIRQLRTERGITLDELATALGQLGDGWAHQQIDVTGTVNDLKTVLDQLGTVIDKHGTDLGAISANLNVVGDILARHQPDLAEVMDRVAVAVLDE